MGQRATVPRPEDLSSEARGRTSGFPYSPRRALEKAKVYLALGRVSNLPTVWTNVITGVTLAGGSLEPKILIPLCFALSLFYTGGMFLNDAFDRELDAKYRPERPLPTGRAAAKEVFSLGYGMLGVALLLLLWISEGSTWAPVISGFGLAVMILYYDLRHKRDPWSPLVMGLCRVLVYFTAALAVAERLPVAVMSGSLVLLSYLIGLTTLAKHETLVGAPRKRSASRENLWPLIFLFTPFLYTIPVLKSGFGVLLYAGFLGWIIYSLFFLRPLFQVRSGLTPKRPLDIARTVGYLIAGISLLDALLMTRQGAFGAASVGVVGFGVTLLAQRYIRGT
jgi:UbiA prenyltransferase family protein